MRKLLTALMLAVTMLAPMVATAAEDNTPRKLPAAVDQLLARDMIQMAQTNLKFAGFNPGRTDGVFDAQTAVAVRQYQVANGIPTSGLLDEPTLRVLLPGSQDAHEG